MKQIVIIITEQHQKDVEVRPGNSIRITHPHFLISLSESMPTNDVAGTLRLAYLRAADQFCETHPADCHNCPAMRMHGASRHHLRVIARNIEEGKTG